MTKSTPYRPPDEPPEALPLWAQLSKLKAQIEQEADPLKLCELRAQRGKLTAEIRRAWQNGRKQL